MRSLLRFRDAATGASSVDLEPLVAARRPKLDPASLGAHLALDVPLARGAGIAATATRTLYDGIEAEVLDDAWGGHAPRAGTPPGRVDVAEACARVRASVERAVERAVGDRTRVAVLASGGIDSSVLLAHTLAVMKRRGGAAFAVAIDFASEGDDRPHLAAVERYLGCEVVRITPEDGVRHLALLREGVDGAPIFWPLAAVQYALFAAAREHGADCLLTGAGGDHFFDGDPRALGPLSLRHPLRAIAAARSLEAFDEPRFPVLERVVRPLVVPHVPRGLRRRVAHRRRSPPPSAAWAGPTLLEVELALWERKLEWTLTRREAESPRAYFEHPQRRHFAWCVHQEQRAGGIDRFDPYFTEGVAAEVASLPPDVLLAGGRRRGLLAESMRGRLPDSVLDRRDKAAFAPAFARFYRAAGGARAFAEALEGRCLGRLGLVAPRAFRVEAARALEAPDEAPCGFAWAAVAAESFLLAHPELT